MKKYRLENGERIINYYQRNEESIIGSKSYFEEDGDKIYSFHSTIHQHIFDLLITGAAYDGPGLLVALQSAYPEFDSYIHMSVIDITKKTNLMKKNLPSNMMSESPYHIGWKIIDEEGLNHVVEEEKISSQAAEQLRDAVEQSMQGLYKVINELESKKGNHSGE